MVPLNLSLEQIALIVAVIAGILIPTSRWWLSSRQKRLRIWEEDYKKHSELIIKDIFQGFNRGYILASCEFTDGRLVHCQPRESEVLKESGIRYIDQARAHLESGYPELWSLYSKAQNDSIEICERIATVISSYKEKVLDTIKRLCPEILRSSQWSPRSFSTYYLDRGVLSVIFSEAFERSRGRSIGTFEIREVVAEITDELDNRRSVNLTELWVSGRGIGRGERLVMEKLYSVVDDLMSDSKIQNLIKDYFKLHEQLGQNKAAENLEKEIRHVFSRIQAGEKLEGLCDLCPSKSFSRARKRLLKFHKTWKFLIIGFAIFGTGIAFFISYQNGMPSERPRGNSGIMFGSNPSHDYEIYEVHFLMEVSPEKRTIWLEFSFVCYEEGDYYLMLSLPYIIDSIEKQSTPSRTKADWYFLNATNGSIVLVIFNVTDPDIGPSSRGEILVVEPIKLSNFGYFVVDIPFGVPYSRDVQMLKEQFPVHVSMGTDKMKGMLRVSIPSSAVIISRTHEITDRRFNEDLQQLEFIIEEPKTFSIQYMLPEKVNEYESKLFLSGILLGVGISIISGEVIDRARGQRTRFVAN